MSERHDMISLAGSEPGSVDSSRCQRFCCVFSQWLYAYSGLVGPIRSLASTCCALRRCTRRRPSSYRKHPFSTSWFSAAAFVQDHFEALPRLACRICDRVSKPAVTTPATRRLRWVCRSTARRDRPRPSSYRNRPNSIAGICMASSVAICGHGALPTFIASLSVFPALNDGDFDATIEIASPVRGSRPVRAGRVLGW